MIDLVTLRKNSSSGEHFEYLYFWGHKTDPWDTRITKACLSQWYPSPFVVDGINYPTAEHWMMAAKARLFKDEKVLAEILATPDPREAKALGREIRKFNQDIWRKNCRRLVTEGNIAKFGMNENLGHFLNATGSKILVEASPDDVLWGIGMTADDPKAKNPKTWEGENLLGFSLMDFRDNLRAT